jgi:hypothetical protein
MPTYVRWYLPDEDIWAYDELDDQRYPLRHIEVRGDGSVTAAAALADVLEARDSGGVQEVRRYESLYGVAPEGPIPTASTEYPISPLTAQAFDDLWRRSRRSIEDRRQAPD